MSIRITPIHFGWSIGLLTLLASAPLQAQCRPGDVLIGEDDRYYYCSSPASSADLEGVVDSYPKERPELLGEEWRFRKAVIDALGSLVRSGTPTIQGGKIRLTTEGRETYFCVATECRDDPRVGVDCSGAVEYGELSACFISGFYRASTHTLEGLWGLKSANEQADYFKRNKAFMGKSSSPSPGDLIFFDKTAKHKGITHVAIFLGTTPDGRTAILHASSREHKVISAYMDSFLSQRLVGYGNISKLYLAATQSPRATRRRK